MALSPHVKSILDCLESIEIASLEKKVNRQDNEGARVEDLDNWTALLKSFDEGLSGRLKALSKAKPAKRGAEIIGLKTTVTKYMKSIQNLPEDGYAMKTAGEGLLPILTRMEEVLSAFEKNTADPGELNMKALKLEAAKWSKVKDSADSRLKKFVQQESKESKATVSLAVKETKAFLANFKPAALAPFADFDTNQTPARKTVAAKLLVLEAALSKKLQAFVYTSTGRGHPLHTDTISERLGKIRKELSGLV